MGQPPLHRAAVGRLAVASYNREVNKHIARVCWNSERWTRPTGELPEGTLEGAATVAVLVPEDEGAFELSDEQVAELTRALAEADRGEGVDGWELLAELRSADSARRATGGVVERA